MVGLSRIAVFRAGVAEAAVAGPRGGMRAGRRLGEWSGADQKVFFSEVGQASPLCFSAVSFFSRLGLFRRFVSFASAREIS